MGCSNRRSTQLHKMSDSRIRRTMVTIFVANNQNIITRVVSLLLLAMTPAIALAQSPPLHIKVINAQTNKPVTNERLNIALKTDEIGSVAMATDKNGVILVDTGDATTIRILSNMYADCRPRSELYIDYPIATILKTGITTG